MIILSWSLMHPMDYGLSKAKREKKWTDAEKRKLHLKWNVNLSDDDDDDHYNDNDAEAIE